MDNSLLGQRMPGGYGAAIDPAMIQKIMQQLGGGMPGGMQGGFPFQGNPNIGNQVPFSQSGSTVPPTYGTSGVWGPTQRYTPANIPGVQQTPQQMMQPWGGSPLAGPSAGPMPPGQPIPSPPPPAMTPNPTLPQNPLMPNPGMMPGIGQGIGNILGSQGGGMMGSLLGQSPIQGNPMGNFQNVLNSLMSGPQSRYRSGNIPPYRHTM